MSRAVVTVPSPMEPRRLVISLRHPASKIVPIHPGRSCRTQIGLASSGHRDLAAAVKQPPLDEQDDDGDGGKPWPQGFVDKSALCGDLDLREVDLVHRGQLGFKGPEQGDTEVRLVIAAGGSRTITIRATEGDARLNNQPVSRSRATTPAKT